MDIRLAEYSGDLYEKYLISLGNTINYFLENTKYKIIVFCTEKLDVAAMEDLYNRINSENSRLKFNTFVDLHNILSLYNDIDLLVGTRMHSTIIALSQNIPYVGISWQQKVTGFFKLTSSEQNMVSLDDFTNDYLSSVNKINCLLKEYNTNVENMEEKKNELKLLFEIDREILARMKNTVANTK